MNGSKSLQPLSCQGLKHKWRQRNKAWGVPITRVKVQLNIRYRDFEKKEENDKLSRKDKLEIVAKSGQRDNTEGGALALHTANWV